MRDDVDPTSDEPKEVVPLQLPEVDDPTGQEALLSRIPHLAGGPRMAAMKADYLGYRASGFPIRQACHLAGITQATLSRWRASDKAFADWETNRLQELQASVGKDIVHLEFIRNMRLSMRADFGILYKAVHNLASLTDREFQYLKRIRSLYSPQDLLAITRALMPESEAPTDFAEMVWRITQTRTEVQIAPKQDKPTKDADIIEGESSEA